MDSEPAAELRREGLRRRPRRDTNHVFDVLGRNTEVVGDLRDTVPGLEEIHEILHASSTAGDQREAKSHRWIDNDLRSPVGGQVNRGSPAIARVVDPVQVAARRVEPAAYTRGEPGERGGSSRSSGAVGSRLVGAMPGSAMGSAGGADRSAARSTGPGKRPASASAIPCSS